MMQEKAVHALVHGRVQGVFFREHTRGRAEELGLRGWVRNLPGGEVETMFAGPAEAVERMVAWLREEGSPASRVDQVEARPVDPAEVEGEGFGVRW